MSGAAPRTAAHRVVVTAGHVDHGKSTLVRALTGTDPDRLDEERRRGLTIELGYAWTDLEVTGADAVTVAFVDVPGHERFVGTMLAGAGPAPTALLVVAADDGWSAQSAEHLDVLALLEVPGVAVALSKADTVTPARLDEVRAEVVAELAGTSLAVAPMVVTDAVTGRGLPALREVLARRLTTLPAPVDRGRPRLWVDRVFTVAGAGTVVTGTLGGGSLSAEDAVVLQPSGRRARIRGLEALGRPVDRSGPGTRLAVNLGGVDRTEVARGDTLSTDDGWIATTTADLAVRVLPGHRLERTGAWHLHAGSARTTVRVLPSAARGGGGLEGGAHGIVRVRLDRPVLLAAGDPVVLREAGRRATVAGGRVADPFPPGRARRLADPQLVGHLAAAASAEPSEALVHLVAAAGGARPGLPALAAVGWRRDRRLPAGLVRVGDHLASPEAVDRWAAPVLDAAREPLDRDRVAALAAEAGAPEGAAAGLADHLEAAGRLGRTVGGWVVPDAIDAATTARTERAEALLTALLTEPFAPPDLDEAARAHGLDHREVADLVRAGQVVRCGKVAFAQAAVDQAVAVLRELSRTTPRFTASDARAAWGTTRRYAIPLLEHLDRTGVTRFDGQHRQLTPRPS